MLKKLAMPTQAQVARVLLQTLFKHGGTVSEFGSGQKIVDEIADKFSLNEKQRSAFLQTEYRKEKRIKKAFLWHRLLFRAADILAKNSLISRPTQTHPLTGRREWMLTERGFEEALNILNIPTEKKDSLPIKSFEVQEVVKKLSGAKRPENYNPIDNEKKPARVSKESAIRRRGFRQAVIEAYNYRCSMCGFKLSSPDSLAWEVEAAHIVPHGYWGRDDIWNGIALCHLHHWAFDVGWLAIQDNFTIQVSNKIDSMPSDMGLFGSYDFLRTFVKKKSKILLPEEKDVQPHYNSLRWHRQNIFHQ